MSIEEVRAKDTYAYSAFFQLEYWCYLSWNRDNMLQYDSIIGALSF